MRNFYPRPPRGGRQPGGKVGIIFSLFLSTPSARRATGADIYIWDLVNISIHALREEGDRLSTRPPRTLSHFYPRPPRGGRLLINHQTHIIRLISIHALREEGDINVSSYAQTTAGFLSTPSARRATGTGFPLIRSFQTFLSTPSARRATLLMSLTRSRTRYFYPRPPRGGRLVRAWV